MSSCLVDKEELKFKRPHNSGRVVVSGGNFAATQSCFNKETQKNFSRMLNSSLHNFPDSCRLNTLGEDVLSEDTPDIDIENRIDKSPVTQQNIVALDVSQVHSNKQLNEHVNQDPICDTQVQTGTLCTFVGQQQNNQGGQQHTSGQDDQFRWKVCQEQSKETTLKTAQPKSFHQENGDVHASNMIIESNPSAACTGYRKLCHNQIIPNSIEQTSTRQKVENSTSLCMKEGTWNQMYSSSFWNYMKPSQSIKAHSITDASRFGKNFNANLHETEWRRSWESDKKETCTSSERMFSRKLEVLLCAVTVSLIVLAVVVVHLLTRVQALESRYEVLFTTRCRCDQEKSTLLNKEALDDAVQSSLEDANTSAGNSPNDANLYKDAYTGEDVIAQQLQKDTINSKDIPKLEETSESNVKNVSQSFRSRDVERGHSSQIKTKMGETDVNSLSDGTDISETTEVNFGKQKSVFSRHIRSTNNESKQQEALVKCIENCYNEKEASEGFKSDVDTFEGFFYKIFDYSKDFTSKDFATHPKWGPDIIAYRDATIYFPQRNTTAEKKEERRLVYTNDTELGVFNIKKNGSYLIHVNITIVDLSGTHFLALHLNDQAMLACPLGGFRCPQTNLEDIAKYRICNIIGLMELNENDRLEIRTMANDVTVRLETHRPSYFSIARLR